MLSSKQIMTAMHSNFFQLLNSYPDVPRLEKYVCICESRAENFNTAENVFKYSNFFSKCLSIVNYCGQLQYSYYKAMCSARESQRVQANLVIMSIEAKNIKS